MEGIVLFSLLFILSWYRRWPEKEPGGQVGVFLLGYGISRIVVEGFREPDAHIGYFIGGTTLGQWLSLPLVLLGLFILLKQTRQRYVDR